jgi:hypothetical protein
MDLNLVSFCGHEEPARFKLEGAPAIGGKSAELR